MFSDPLLERHLSPLRCVIAARVFLTVSLSARRSWAGYSARMRGGFTGWPEQAMDVLWQLQGEPAHAARERCRADRERLVRQPMIALLNEVADSDARY